MSGSGDQKTTGNRVFPAVDLLALDLDRWGIERVFQQITEVFRLQQLIGSTPQATASKRRRSRAVSSRGAATPSA